MSDEQSTASSRYSELSRSREPYLTRARECSKFTIPSLVPPDGTNSTSKLYKPYQSIGARGVNNLAGKLVMALLPPTQAFFRLRADEASLANATPEEISQIDDTLSQIEQRIMAEVENRAMRVSGFEAFKHLIVSGNVLMYIPGKGKQVRVFPLHKYVVLRDGEGNPLCIVVKECVSWRSLPQTDGFRDAIKAEIDKQPDAEKNVDLYTVIELDDTAKTPRWKVRQEVMGQKVPGSDGDYPPDKLPWLPLRWTRIDGEDYGRGLCDEYIGDLLSLEGLSEHIVAAAAAAARVLFLVAPNAHTSEKDLRDAPNLSVRTGSKDDVTVVSLDKYADMQVAQKTAESIETRLAYAFLMNSAIQRQAERVTAEEIRYMANEIENALGGVYSVLSAEFQRPVIVILKAQMEQAKQIPPLPKGVVNLSVITGLDALGRSQEMTRLDMLVADAVEKFGPAGTARINISEWYKRAAAALGIKDQGLIYTEDQVAQQTQLQQQNATMQSVAPNLVKAFSDHLSQMQQAQQQGQASAQPAAAGEPTQ